MEALPDIDPILYSFRRCPYAIRARLALASSGQRVVLREVVLRDKPRAFLETSPTATVPCLKTAEGVIDESLDIMVWALRRNDPEHWLDMPAEGFALIAQCDGPFKTALDRTKYPSRYPDADPAAARDAASDFLDDLNRRIEHWLFGRPTLADFAILPFVRQFAFVDKADFDAQPWPALHAWLEDFLASERFASVMEKLPQWRWGDPPTHLP